MSNLPKGNPYRLLYIMGTGRSGTTVLEIMLSANEDVCSLGELTHIFRDGFGENNTCACGSPFSRCEFWSLVKQRFAYESDKIVHASNLLHKIDWHKGFLKLISHTHFKKDLSSYTQINKELYNACAAVSEKNIIIDSSKYPARALMLNRIYGSAVKIICLTRSPEGILKSFQKTDVEQTAKSPFGALIYYIYVLFCCRIVSLLTNNVLFITFEELKASPEQILKKIESYTGLSFDQTRITLKNNVAFRPGHIMTGNRLRKNKYVIFQKSYQQSTWIPVKHKPFLYLMKASKRILGF